MRIPWLSVALAAVLGCGLAWLPAAEAQTCMNQTVHRCLYPPIPVPPQNVSPLKTSRFGHYFRPAGTETIPLIGQSYEYLCHVCQETVGPGPTRDQQYCTLKTYPGLLSQMSANRNNVIRLETIFNHSPGFVPCTVPYFDEQPFKLRGNKWDLTMQNMHYFNNLEAVVNAAYNDHIVVEVTLFNPWDGDWTHGPFYSLTSKVNNTVAVNGVHPGFTAPQYFASYECYPPDSRCPAQPADLSAVNKAGRTAQRLAVKWVVQALKKYPNVIWEIANEPDFLFKDNIKNTGITPTQVFAWEQDMVQVVIQNDPPPPGGSKAAHLIELNGHTVDTFAWTQPVFPWTPPGTPPVLTSVETAHYTDIDQGKHAGYFGAIQLMNATDSSIMTGRLGMPVGFTEDISLPHYLNNDPLHQPEDRSEADVRTEAFEFMIHGGATYDGYSLDYSYTDAQNLSKRELFNLANILNPQPGTVGVKWLDAMQPGSSNGTCNWCSGITPSTTLDEGDCHGTGANIYWSTIQQFTPYRGMPAGDRLLYVHHGVPRGDAFDGYKAMPCVVSGDTSKGYHLDNLQYRVQVPGCYQEIWEDPATGTVLKSTNVQLSVNAPPAPPTPIAYKPTFAQDILLYLKLLVPNGNCSNPPPLSSSFSYTCTGLSCYFDGSHSTPSSMINGYSWMWDDGTWTSPSSSQQAAYTFAAPGTYVVALAVSDPSGDVSSDGEQVTVTSRPPSPSFTASCNQLSCTFNGGGSTPGDAPISLYSWTFGDAGSADNVIAPAYSYAGGGTYSVTLTVTDNFGIMSSTAQTITVIGPPVADFSATCSGLTCAFDASGTTGDSAIVSYAWTFGDGNSGSGVAPSHTYGSGSDFTVTLTATDANGQAGVETGIVTVAGPPTANFVVSCVNRTCTVHSTSTDGGNPIAQWQWNWGDGSPTITPTSPYPWADQTYTYAHSGRYTITLTVIDTIGMSSSLQLAVLANTAPVAANDSATTERELPVTINVLANDTDADGDPLSIASVNLQSYPGASYQVVQSGSSWALKVTPPNTFVGTMTFTYVAYDPWGATSTATVTLTVTQSTVIVNALGDQFYCPQNGSLRIPRSTLLANDYDQAGQTLTIVAFDTSVLMGTLDCTSDPTACTYRPPTNAAGYTYFYYTVSDPVGRTSTAKVAIYVGVSNQAPTAKDVFFTTSMNTPRTFTYQDVVQGDPDPDGDTLTVGGLQSGPRAYGSLTCTTPMYSCTYTPNPGYVGTDRFTYTASDGINPPATATVNILTLPPTTPAFDAREDVIVTGQNQSVYFSSGLLANDYAPSGGPITVTGLDTTGLNGSLSCTASGCTYYPPSYFAGVTTFKYTANDGHGATDTAIVKIKVGVTNNPPVAVPQTLATPKNTALRFSVFQLMQNSYDPDNDPLTVTVYTVTAHLGTLSCGTPNYWCVYTPNANTTGADAISYALSDGTTSVTSTVTINITP
jgi:PKD repeat protein